MCPSMTLRAVGQSSVLLLSSLSSPLQVVCRQTYSDLTHVHGRLPHHNSAMSNKKAIIPEENVQHKCRIIHATTTKQQIRFCVFEQVFCSKAEASLASVSENAAAKQP